MKARYELGEGPTMAGSGRCTSYIDEPICESDMQCKWRPATAKRTGHCALKKFSKVMGRTGTAKQKEAAAKNPWFAHVAAFRAANPGMAYKDALKAASATYTKKAK